MAVAKGRRFGWMNRPPPQGGPNLFVPDKASGAIFKMFSRSSSQLPWELGRVDVSKSIDEVPGELAQVALVLSTHHKFYGDVGGCLLRLHESVIGTTRRDVRVAAAIGESRP
jgi:hypothetical protein